MNRLPIRIKLTAAFASAMLLMLFAAALFVYLRLRGDLDDRVNASLRARAEAAVVAVAAGTHIEGVALEDPEETFVQLLGPAGQVLETAGRVRGAALTPEQVLRATTDDLVVQRRLPGVDGEARILGRGSGARRGQSLVVIGQSLNDRNDALSGVIDSFVIGSAAALFLASSIGYALATVGLSPVEAMRRRAREVSLHANDQGLPLPAARDELRRLGETLNEMLERLRDSFERERRFVDDASHELRTPIAIIKTELEGALRQRGYGIDVRDALVAAANECDRLARLADDLLVLARAVDGRLPVRPEQLPARDVLATVVDQFVERAALDGRHIRLDVEPGVRVNADRQRLRQVVTNLLDNAIRHGEGDIAVLVRDDDGVAIEVCDRGAGFTQSFAEHAFERFTRADLARTRPGSGLGLAIVRTIVEAHRGRATIVPGAPGRVQVWFPRKFDG